MTKKIRLTRTMVVEYEPNPEYYPEGLTIEEMAQHDMELDDVESLFSDITDEKISYEIIESEDEEK